MTKLWFCEMDASMTGKRYLRLMVGRGIPKAARKASGYLEH